MSELSQGLLIAVPAVISAVASAWVAVHASRAGAEQAAVAITAEHAQWLRDKRSDIYQPMSRFLLSRRTYRIAKVKAGPVSAAEAETTTAEFRRWRESPEANELLADSTIYISPELGEAFDHALVANLVAWEVFLDDATLDAAGSTGVMGVITKRVEQALRAANDAERKVFNMINADVTWTDSPAYRRRIRGQTGG